MPPPRPASGDTIYVMYAYGKIDHYCMSILACQYNQPKRPGDLNLLTLKVVSESRVTWATSVPILVFLGLSVLELHPMYATDRQTSDRETSDVRQKHRFMPPPIRGGGIISNNTVIRLAQWHRSKGAGLAINRLQSRLLALHASSASRSHTVPIIKQYNWAPHQCSF